MASIGKVSGQQNGKVQMKSGHNQNLQKHTKQSNIFHQVHFMIKIEMTGETHYHYKSYCQS